MQPTQKFIKVTKAISSTSRVPCPEGPVVAAEDGGRLGNKAWEYAAVWSLSKLLGRSGYVPHSMLKVLSNVFANLSLTSLESVSHCNLKFTEPVKRYQLLPIKMLPQRFKNQNLLLHKWMVFPDTTIMYRKQLLKEFTFLPTISKFVHDTLKNFTANYKHLKKNVTFVGVHVRRSDFQTWLPMKYNKTLVEAQYFLDVMSWFRKKLASETPIFLIFSDDPMWCKSEIVKNSTDIILVSDMLHTYAAQDLALLASCNHTIIDYGTFGELGAFIAAGGITVTIGVDGYFNSIAKKILKWKIWKLQKHK